MTSNQSLLLSRYGLDAKPFDSGCYYPTWEKSDIRAWLNEDFALAAFTLEERCRFIKTRLCTDDNDFWEPLHFYHQTRGGRDTGDWVFLLSVGEAMHYAGIKSHREFRYNGSDLLKTEPTEYAVNNGARKDSENGCCWWWLRTPGFYRTTASCVYFQGYLSCDRVSSTRGCVRPAMWVDLRDL